MGLFRRHKDKEPESFPDSDESPSEHRSTTDTNDSTYGSHVASEDHNERSVQPEQDQLKPGTTVTTTTTTTTTSKCPEPLASILSGWIILIMSIATSVVADGSTRTATHPYNPSTDPPPDSQVTYCAPASSVASSKQSSAATSTVDPDGQVHDLSQGRRPSASTIGGRTIPERSSLRNSRDSLQAHAIAADPTLLGSRTPQQAPDNLAVPGERRGPSSPAMGAPSNNQPPNYSRPAFSASPQPSPTGNDGMPKRHTKEELRSAAKGIHGASEAFRGAFNERLAMVDGNSLERERMRQIKESGMQELNGSGFREKAEQRMRLRKSRELAPQAPDVGLKTVNERRAI